MWLGRYTNRFTIWFLLATVMAIPPLFDRFATGHLKPGTRAMLAVALRLAAG